MHSNLTPQEPRLDVERGIAAMGSPAALRLVLQVAYTSLQQDLPVIAHALAAGDVQPAVERLHGIKGYLPLFASEALAHGMLLLERRCSTEPADTLIAEFGDLRPALVQLLSEISSYLALESLPPQPIAGQN
ncbi:MAG: hypothetical protein EXR34_03145 [Rhodoferax sp.]|nr:hypothetical protein [Rhodoferax sp.]